MLKMNEETHCQPFEFVEQSVVVFGNEGKCEHWGENKLNYYSKGVHALTVLQEFLMVVQETPQQKITWILREQ